MTWPGLTFALEHRELVESILGPVDLVELHGTVTLDRVEPLVRYAQSSREFYERQSAAVADVVARFEALARARLERDGAIVAPDPLGPVRQAHLTDCVRRRQPERADSVRRIGDVGLDQAVKVTRPASRTTRPSSPVVWKTASPSPSTHIFTVSASPGKTGDEKRPSIEREPGRVAAAQRVQQRPAGEAVGAQPVQDRPVEAAHRGERRVGVQRVAVARQPVEQRLVRAGRRR